MTTPDPRLDPGEGLQERFAELPDGRRLRYVTAGTTGPVVVFEAGLGGSSGTWVAVQRALAGRARTIAYDRSGTGVSDPDADGVDRNLDRLVDDLIAFLDAVSLDEPAVFVGHSWGGPIIRLLADRAPERVAGLVFVDATNAVVLGLMPSWVHPLVFGAMALLVRVGFRQIGARAFQVHPWTEVSDADRVIACRDLVSVSGLRYAQREARGIRASKPVLARLDATPLPASMPAVYLVGGRRDKGAGKVREAMLSESSRLTALSPRARRHVVEQAGHVILLESPAETVAEVGKLLDEVEPARS